jgi:hypothetical protein
MGSLHRWRLLAVAAGWTLLMLPGASLQPEVVKCLALQPAANKACQDAAEVQWAVTGSPWFWGLLIVAGWLVIAVVDTLQHRQARRDGRAG